MRVRGPSVTGGTVARLSAHCQHVVSTLSWSEESWSLTTLRPDPGPSAEGYLVSLGSNPDALPASRPGYAERVAAARLSRESMAPTGAIRAAPFIRSVSAAPGPGIAA